MTSAIDTAFIINNLIDTFGGKIQKNKQHFYWIVPQAAFQHLKYSAYDYIVAMANELFCNTQHTVDADHNSFILEVSVPDTVHNHPTLIPQYIPNSNIIQLHNTQRMVG
jgi:hypothetical protein